MQAHADPLTGIPVDSPLFRQRAQHVELTGDSDTDTRLTVQAMCRMAREASQDETVCRMAAAAVNQFRGGPRFLGSLLSDPRAKAESVFWWCKHYLKFRHHGDMFEVWASDLGSPLNKLQLLIAPEILLRMERMEGDCAIFTTMVCAMLGALGVRWQICPCAVSHLEPTIFGHVFARALVNDGPLSLDASHGPYPGWQVPQEDMMRLWIFDENGVQVSNGPESRFGGLHAYRRRRGLGVEGDAPDQTDTSGGGIGPGTLNCPGDPGCPGYVAPSVDPSTGGYVAPSNSSAAWAAFASTLAKAGMTLAEINAIQPGTVVSANGAILRQSTGYPVGTSPLTNLTGSSSSVLIYGVLGIGALLVVASMLKGGGR